MAATINFFSGILLLCMIYSATCYKSCKEIGEANCNPQNRTYVVEQDGEEVTVYCEFMGTSGLQYTCNETTDNCDITYHEGGEFSARFIPDGQFTDNPNFQFGKPSWATDGVPFDYESQCCPKEVTTAGTDCQDGKCLNIDCHECKSGFQVAGCDVHNTNEASFQCCRDHPNPNGECRIFPDPHVQRFNGYGNEVQTTGWYLLTQPCTGDWKIYAKFYRINPSDSYTLIDRVMVLKGNTYIWIDKNRIAGAGTTAAPNSISVPAAPTPLLSLIPGLDYTIDVIGGLNPTYISIDNGDAKVTLSGTWMQAVISLKPKYIGDLCGGVCGVWNFTRLLLPINNTDWEWDDGTNYERRRRAAIKEERQENPISSVKEKRDPSCTTAGDPASIAWCALNMDGDVVNCPEINTELYRGYCHLDYCLGGVTGAVMSLGVFLDACYPPKQSSCFLCGFRTYTTFDGAEYNFLGAECEYIVAANCSNAPADETWEVKIKQKKETLKDVDAMMIEKVMIHYHGEDIEFVRNPKSVMVGGTTMTADNYADPTIGFIISYYGNMVVFKAVDMEITYNFRQFLKIVMEEKWFDDTCGMCGDWNDLQNDDYPEQEIYPPIPDQCYGNATQGCESESEMQVARQMCLEELEAVDCAEIHPLTQVDRCAQEYCVGKKAYLCENILGYMDKCFDLNGREKMLDHEPQACKETIVGKKKKQKKHKYRKAPRLTQSVKIIHH